MYGTLANSLEYVAVHLAAAVAAAGISDLFGAELVILLAVYLAARKCANFGEQFFERIETLGTQFAGRTVAAPLALAGAVIIVRLAILPVHPIPHPIVVDEFSHLLLADTLAHGRLTNPTHPLWRSFETIHTLQRPSYNSMYFPGPALLLLLGQIIWGQPWFGVLFGTAALCALVCWALRAWFPPRWALLGGILTALHIGIVSYWMDGYWGGTFAAIGGVLLLGAFARVQKMKSPFRNSALMALGIGMLANSRPYEGIALCIPVGVRLAGWLFENDPGQKLLRSIVPMALCLAVMGASMGIYFKAVTGGPALLPYTVNEQQYGWPTTLPWTEVRNVSHDRPEFTDYFLYELDQRSYFWTLTKFIGGTAIRLQNDWRFFVGPALTLPLLFLPRIYRNHRLRFLLFAGAIVIFAAFSESHFPHYIAPALLPIVAACVQGYRHLRQGHGEKQQLGLRLSRAIPLVVMATVALRVAATPLHLPHHYLAGYASWCCSDPGSVDRHAVERVLPPGRHLLLVRYRPDHRWMNDWVHNGADIDGARVVWARELGGETDAKLLAYFKDRQVWLVEPDAVPPRVTPYSSGPKENLSANKLPQRTELP